MQKQIYPSDLTDSQWKHIKDLFPVHTGRGRPRELDLRQILNAIFYLLRTGCQWRYLPIEYPCWQSVYYYLRLWQRTGIWQRIHDRLRSELRRTSHRHKHPTAGCLDSQAVKTTSVPGIRGYTRANESTAENGIRWLIRSAYCWSSWFTPPTSPKCQSQTGFQTNARQLQKTAARVARWRIFRNAFRLVKQAIWSDTANRQTGCRTKRLRGFAASLRSRAHFRVAQQSSSLIERLRT